MRSQKGLSLLELIIGLGLMGITLAVLFNLFSTSYAAANTAKSKLLINTQERIIQAHLMKQSYGIKKIALPFHNQSDNIRNITEKLEFTTLDHTTIIVQSSNRCLIITENGNERFRSEPCIKAVQFKTDQARPRYVQIKIIFYDPQNAAVQDYTYEETFYAPNAERI